MKSSATALVSIAAAPAKGARPGTAAAATAGDFLRLIGADALAAKSPAAKNLAAKKADTARGGTAETSLPVPGARPNPDTGGPSRAVKASKAQPVDSARESTAGAAVPIPEIPEGEAGVLHTSHGVNPPLDKPPRSQALGNGDAARAAGSSALHAKWHPQETGPTPGARARGDATTADAHAAFRVPSAIPPTTGASGAKLESSLATLAAAEHHPDSAMTPSDDAAIRALTRAAERGASSAVGTSGSAAPSDSAMRPAAAGPRAAKADTPSSSSNVLLSPIRSSGRPAPSTAHPDPSSAAGLAEARAATSAERLSGTARSGGTRVVESRTGGGEAAASPAVARSSAGDDTRISVHHPEAGKPAAAAELRAGTATKLDRSAGTPTEAVFGSAIRRAADDTVRIDLSRARISETVGSAVAPEPRQSELRAIPATARRTAASVDRTAGSSDEAASVRDARPPASTATAEAKPAAGSDRRATASSRNVTAAGNQPADGLRKAGADAIAPGVTAGSELRTAETQPAAAAPLVTTMLAAGADGEVRAARTKAARAEARSDAREAAASDKSPSSEPEKTQPTAATLDRAAKDADKPASAGRFESGAVDVNLPAAHAGHDALVPGQNGGRPADTWASPVRDVAFQPAAPAVTIRVHTSNGATRAIEIRLDPPELGTVDVRLETGRDGQLKAVLQADNVQALELLKREAGTLEAALRDAGVTLSEEGLSFTLNNSGENSGAAHERERSYSGASARQGKSIDDDAIAPTSRRDGGVDISV